MTTTTTAVNQFTVDQDACAREAEAYKAGLPPHPLNPKGTGWTIDTFATWVSLRYPWVSVDPGQEWPGARDPLNLTCLAHGPYRARPLNLLAPNRGCNCKWCQADISQARQAAITAAFVGQTTADGHVILEHVGYADPSPAAVKRGDKNGPAKFRYRCGCCGNEEAVASGNDLKKVGHVTGCPKCSKDRRESLGSFKAHPDKAERPALLYIVSMDCDEYLKIGITNYSCKGIEESIYTRGKGGCPHKGKNTEGDTYGVYDGTLFHTDVLPRAYVWVAEQVALRASQQWILEDNELPAELVTWGGRSEIRQFEMDLDYIQNVIEQVLSDIDEMDGDFAAVYSLWMKRLNARMSGDKDLVLEALAESMAAKKIVAAKKAQEQQQQEQSELAFREEVRAWLEQMTVGYSNNNQAIPATAN